MNSNTDRRNEKDKNTQKEAPNRQINWPLLVGILLVSFITFLAIMGPDLAPKDPMEENLIVQINGEWYVPPFDFNTPGYPFGSDMFGRDLYSRMLWGVRPTMIMVFLVAVVRLVLGVIIGLSAGWFTGKTSRFLNGLIQVALALPVLLVALGAIAIIGVEFGIWAFIIGLSLTGWVDTALQVREQTRIVKGQAYIEAASALGATSQQVLSNHILKQITPMLLMLFAFEVSSTLMLTAGLGFLGYYIGGDVWVDTADFVARRISGTPELGQMLATSWVTLTKPWALVVAGTTVFLTVLGFNLIGEGLRQNIGFTKVHQRTVFQETRLLVGAWIDNYIWHPLVQVFALRPVRIGFFGIAAFFILTLGALLMLDAASSSDVSSVLARFDQSIITPSTADTTSLPVNTMELSTPEELIGTKTYDPRITWEFFDESGFSSGLAISPEGDRLYTTSNDGFLYSLDLDGNVIWQAQLSAGGMGIPAIEENGDILVADKSGGLSRISPQGEIRWHFQTEAGNRSHSGPTIGVDGTIYYTVGTSGRGFVQAVSPEGEGLWVTQTETNSFYEPPVPSQDGQYVFLKDDVFATNSGEIIHLESDVDILRFFSGEDGQNYFIAGHNVIQWQENNGVIELIDIAEWDSSHFSSSISPREAIVNEDKVATLLYTTPGGNSTVVWVTMEDQLVGISETDISGSTLVSISNDLNAIVCGGGSFKPISTDCAALSPYSDEQLWQIHVGNYGPVTGGVVVGERLFFATEEGYVFEINENPIEVAVSQNSEEPSFSLGTVSEPGILWTYQLSDRIVNRPIFGSDGTVYVLTRDDKLHVLSPDQNSKSVIQLGASPYYQESETGRSAPLDITPEVLPDGTIIIVSEDLNVSAFDAEGNLLWEHQLDFEPGNRPIQDGHGNLYLLDDEAGLYLINNNGVQWRYQSEAAPHLANGFSIGPDGMSYYVVTDYSKAFIQAVSSSGEGEWVSRVTTRDFFNDLHISADGNFVSLAENLFDANTGELIEVDAENKIDEFIFGSDGRNYYRSLHSVYEWQPGVQGIVIVNQSVVSEEDVNFFPPLSADADNNGIIWIFYPESYTGRGIIIAWTTAEGELLGRHLMERQAYTFYSSDYDKSTLTECHYFEDSQVLECTTLSPLFDEPLMQNSITGIAPFQQGYFDHNHAIFTYEDDSLVLVNIGEPSFPTEE